MTEQDNPQALTDAAATADQVNTEVKGPGPEWTSDNSLLEAPIAGGGIADHGLAIGEIRGEGTENEVKGPGPEWSHLYEGGSQ